MAFGADCAILFDRLDEELRGAPALVPGLFAKVIACACSRLPALQAAGPDARLDRLIAAGAWTDAALALVELELRAWSVRRLVCDDGQWLCSLTRQPNLPAVLDDD